MNFSEFTGGSLCFYSFFWKALRAFDLQARSVNVCKSTNELKLCDGRSVWDAAAHFICFLWLFFPLLSDPTEEDWNNWLTHWYQAERDALMIKGNPVSRKMKIKIVLWSLKRQRFSAWFVIKLHCSVGRKWLQLHFDIFLIHNFFFYLKCFMCKDQVLICGK